MVLSKPIINSSVHSVHELLRKEGWLGREGGSWKVSTSLGGAKWILERRSEKCLLEGGAEGCGRKGLTSQN